MPPQYDPVPDVEEGLIDEDEELTAGEILIQRAAEKYPAAGSELERECLGRLDDAIDNAKPEIKIPRLSAEQLQGEDGASDLQELLSSLKLPTAALGATLGTAVVVVLTNNPIAQALYPYYACILTFLSSIPDITARFLKSITPVFNKMTSVKNNVERKVQGVANKGMKYLNTTEGSVNRALAPIKDKLAYATKAETMLKTIDPSIDIPDTTDIERSFDGYEGQLRDGFEGMNNLVDFSKSLPAPLQSFSKFKMYIVYPFLAIALVMQLVGVWKASHAVSKGGHALTYSAYDREDAAFFEDLDDLDTLGAKAPSGAPKDENEWSIMWIAVQTYLTTVFQIVIAFLMTQGRLIIGLANGQIGKLEKNINGQLKESVGDVFETIFKKGFGTVKGKFLDLVQKIERIEGPLKAVQAKLPAGLPAGLPSLPAGAPSMPAGISSGLKRFGL